MYKPRPPKRPKAPGDRKPVPSYPNETLKDDPVARPSHYQSKDGKFQVWDIIDAFDLSYYLATAVKYICRAGKKRRSPAVQDIQKAIQYLQRWVDNQVKERNDE